MKYKRRAQETIQKLLAAFAAGHIAQPLSVRYLQRDNPPPMHTWSLQNVLLCLIAGATDARGYKMWQAVGRQVRHGEKACTHILIPIIKRREDEARKDEARKNEDKQNRLIGFTSQPVFDVTQTEGDPLPDGDNPQFLNSLPLINVAYHWQIDVSTYAGQPGMARGVHRQTLLGEQILLGTENLIVWLHELVHAADNKNGNLVEKGQHYRSEAVAQLGACTLAHLIGQPEEADEGLTWNYISNYAEAAGRAPLSVCTEVLERTCQAIDLILVTGDEMITIGEDECLDIYCPCAPEDLSHPSETASEAKVSIGTGGNP